MKKARLPRSIIFVVVIYLVAAMSAAISLQNVDFLRIYIPFFIATAMLIAFLHRRIHFSDALLWFLTLWGALHLAGRLVAIPSTWDYDGKDQILYSWWVVGQWLRYDHILHAFGFGTCTWLTWEALRASIQQRLGRKLYPSMGMLFLCIFASMGLGAINETIEFLFIIDRSTLTISNYINTCQHLIANLLGALLVTVLIIFRG